MKSNFVLKLFIIASLVVLVGTFLLSLFFRFWKLDTIPYGLNWDEAAYAYNAYSILHTGKDEWGVQFPIFLKSFGDYKPALLSYLQIPFIHFWGLNVLAARLPVALLSIVSVTAWIGMQSSLNFFKDSRFKQYLLILGAVVFSTAPWLVHYSRAAMDPIVSFAFLLLGLSLFISKKSVMRWFGVLFLILAMYTYNSARLFVPLIIATQFIIFEREDIRTLIRRCLPRLFQYGVVLVASVLILGLSLYSEAGARAQSVFILRNPIIYTSTDESLYRSVVLELPGLRLFANKGITSIYVLAKNYVAHFDPSFLFFDSVLSPRHGFSRHGNLLLISLPFILLGILFQKHPRKNDWFFIVWLLAAVIPSALSDDVPHSGRTLIQLPAYVYFTIRGVELFLSQVSRVSISKKIPIAEFLMFTISVALCFNVTLYFIDIYRYFPEESYTAWQGDARTVMAYVQENATQDEHIVLSLELVENYLFYPFYTAQDPRLVQHRHQMELDPFKYENAHVSKIDACALSQADAMIVSEKKLEIPILWEDIITAETRFGEPSTLGYVYKTTVFPDSYLAELAQSCADRQ